MDAQAIAKGDYRQLFSGRLSGLLRWEQFEDLWASLAERPEGWFVRDFKTGAIPDEPLSAEEMRAFLAEAESFLRKRHREDYCGFLYLDDREDPSFIKVFDPRKMGSACGCGGQIVPRWTISRMKPRPLNDEMPDAGARNGAGARRSLLSRLFGGK